VGHGLADRLRAARHGNKQARLLAEAADWVDAHQPKPVSAKKAAPKKTAPKK